MGSSAASCCAGVPASLVRKDRRRAARACELWVAGDWCDGVVVEEVEQRRGRRRGWGQGREGRGMTSSISASAEPAHGRELAGGRVLPGDGDARRWDAGGRRRKGDRRLERSVEEDEGAGRGGGARVSVARQGVADVVVVVVVEMGRWADGQMLDGSLGSGKR